MRLNIPRLDTEKENGVWREYYSLRFLIARFNGPHAVAVRERLLSEVKEGLTGSGELTKEKLDEIGKRVIAEGVLIGWEGVIDIDTNEPIPYSPQMAFDLLWDESRKDFCNFIVTESQNIQNYFESIKVSAEKKS